MNSCVEKNLNPRASSGMKDHSKTAAIYLESGGDKRAPFAAATKPSVREQSKLPSTIHTEKTERHRLNLDNPKKVRPRVSSETSDLSKMIDIDLESGTNLRVPFVATAGPSVREQSKRLSKILTEKTEMHRLNLDNPDGPTNITEETETSGVKYWLQEVNTAKEHGGDYSQRHKAGVRAALGSFTVFSALVFPHQQIFGAVWIGNIFMHSNIKDSFGASVISVRGFANSIILTTVFSFPIVSFLTSLEVNHAAILLPFLVFFLSFVIMSCPQLTARNLMILVMYIMVASNVREDIGWWEPFGWVITYLFGLVVAVVVNVFPKPNFALNDTHKLLDRLEKDFTMYLRQCMAYSKHTSSTPRLSKNAIASIEMLHTRLTKTIKKLKSKLAPSKVELSCLCRGEAANDLNEWILQTEKLLAPLKSTRTALTQRVLGEEYSMYSSVLTEAKAIIDHEVGPARDRMVDAMIASVAVCNAWADPSSHRVVLPDVQEELSASLDDCKHAFHRAAHKAGELLETNKHGNVPVFAHLTRRMTGFKAMFELAESLLDYLRRHNWEAEEIKSTRQTPRPSNCVGPAFWCIGDYVGANWLWHNQDSFRLALKTSVGMFFASMFVSIQYLWNISAPFGVWPGLTIASVNLGDTGSSFHKASDRLFGTLLAAAYALLVSDLFPGNMDSCKIPAITVFTYVLIYMRDSDHAYKYTYAATSIGSMLYGSVKNDFNIAGYIPKRIELIFVGVALFGFVELLLFPRSSRKIVERMSFQYFMAVRDYLRQAMICAHRMEAFVQDAASHTAYVDAVLGENDDPFQLKKLADLHGKMKLLSSKLKKEVISGLAEPHVGLSLKLDPEAFRGLSKELGGCEVQALLVLKALKTLGSYYMEVDHPVRKTNWPFLYKQFFEDASTVADQACDWLMAAYPDGRLRAQEGNAVKAVTAASTFRCFEDVRLRTLAAWSDNYSHFIQMKGFEGSDPVAVTTVGITVTYFLELCHHLQKAGKYVEHVSHNFPAGDDS